MTMMPRPSRPAPTLQATVGNPPFEPSYGRGLGLTLLSAQPPGPSCAVDTRTLGIGMDMVVRDSLDPPRTLAGEAAAEG